jgi:MerR family copper efflux transcriptional regulator
MGTFTIGQVAERTGFTASSLRYYEGIGLVVPAGRSEAGYRLYDEATLTRLSFVARAKQLGCTLEEITDLLEVWDESSCGPVQRRFHALVTEKIVATEQRLAELGAFSRQLRTAAEHLGGQPVDGPCDSTCACVAAPVAPVAVPVACSLPAGEVADRTGEWTALLAHATHRTATADGGLRLGLDPATPVDELVRLVAAEQDCCGFLSFAVTVDARGLALEVRAPAGAEVVVDALFGAAA